MNKTYLALPVLVFAALVLCMPSARVSATVGGPTYISQIAYKASDNSIYYVVSDMGGQGCPPIIHAQNVATGKVTQVKSCNAVLEQYFMTGSDSDQRKYDTFLYSFFEGLPYLGSISLPKNNIAVRVEVLSERVEDGFPMYTDFRAHVTQDNKEVATLNFRGCSKDQPHLFEGYRIPNTDTMVMLISNKGDCYEEGYVKESISIIKGVRYYNTDVVRSYKQASAAEPNTGNLIVSATTKAPSTTEATTTPTLQQNPITPTMGALLAALFAVGGALGYMLGRRSRSLPTPTTPAA